MFATSPIVGALRHRPFGTLWAGQVFSQVGDGLQRVALAWWVLRHSSSGFDMALVLACSYVPSILFAAWGGTLADRLPRTRVMAACDLLRGLLLLLIGGLALGGGLELWHLYILAALLGTAEAFFTPAYEAAVPWVTPAALLAGANALRSVGYDTSDIVGMTIGGMAIAAWGPALIFLINGVSYLVAAACALAVGRMTGERRPQPTRAPGRWWEEASVGLRVVRDTPWLSAGIGACILLNTLQNAIMIIGLPLLAAGGREAQPSDLGLTMGAVAAGSLAMALWLGRRQLPARQLSLFCYGGAAVCGLAMLGVGANDSWWIVALCAAIYGASLTAGGLAWTRALQLSIPDEIFGRVSAVDSAVSWICGPLGVLLAGALMTADNAAMLIAAGGAASIVVALAALWLPITRDMGCQTTDKLERASAGLPAGEAA